MSDFVLAEVLRKYNTDGHVNSHTDYVDLPASTRKEQLITLIDTLSTNTDSVLDPEIYESLCAEIVALASASSAHIKQFIDLLTATLSAKTVHVSSEDPDDLVPSSSSRKVLEILSYLLYASITLVQTRVTDLATTDGAKTKQKGSKRKDTTVTFDSASLLESALDAMSKVLALRAQKMWPTTTERDNFVSLFTKPVYLITENESLMRNSRIRLRVYKVICVAVKHYGHAFGAQTSIIQNLQYFEHLPEHMAELLQILAEQYDFPQLTDDILRDLSEQEFNANDTKGPKSVSAFLVKLSELMPKQVLKQMTLLSRFLDSEAYGLRSAIIEISGNLLISLSQEDAGDSAEAQKLQINNFFDLLEERFLDVNPYCRAKVLQTYVKICDLPKKYPKRRQIVCELAVRSLEDKSSTVRRNAIKLMSKLIQTHQFDVLHGPHLIQSEWHERHIQTMKELNMLNPSAEGVDSAIDAGLIEEPTSPHRDAVEERQDLAKELEQRRTAMETEAKVAHLQMLRKFYTEALKFIEALSIGADLAMHLLASKTKTEVIEAMDFFVTADAFKLEFSREGIRRMLHLIWTKATSDEGKGVKTHLLDCYRTLYFETPLELCHNDASNMVAKNMISLTYGATLAELTSLEQLLKIFMQEGQFSDDVINKLWQVFGVQSRDISRNQRRGAIIVLGMLALASQEIIINGLDILLQIAFGPIGRNDLALMRYACIALQRLGMTERQKGDVQKKTTRLPNTHGIFVKLMDVVSKYTPSKEWFGVAEQAINAIYALAEHPDELMSDTIKQMTKTVFGKSNSSPPESRASSPEPENDKHASPPARALADLLFVIGHTSIKQIVYQEECEGEFKRKKTEADKVKNMSPSKTAAVKDELDQVVGASEDAFTEHMMYVREQELLYGDKSHWLLARFGPLIINICKNNTRFSDKTLQSCATMALAKFMCVSSRFCEQNLPLLLTILKNSSDAATRSDLVIAIGDMTVCHNQVLDGCSDHLYARLRDRDPTVKKTCLMTLTFLVLAGQVKVKGQLGEMAKCLEDEDKRIADLARMFFTELSTKDNAIYNGFTDIFSLLSAGSEELEEDIFRRIIKFLLGFIEKDKYAKQLAEKLAGRLVHCQTQRQFDDCVFALNALPSTAKSETIQKAISDGFKFAEE